MENIAENVQKVLERVDRAASRAGHAVTLVAASKTQLTVAVRSNRLALGGRLFSATAMSCTFVATVAAASCNGRKTPRANNLHMTAIGYHIHAGVATGGPVIRAGIPPPRRWGFAVGRKSGRITGR